MKKYKLFPFFGLLFISVVGVSLIVSTHTSWNNAMNKYLPLQKEVELVKSNLSQAHLWLEEAISGDPYVDIEKDIMIPLSHQSFHNYLKTAKDSLDNDQKYLTQLTDLEEQLEVFLEVAKQRWSMSKTYGIGSDLDQKFDQKFNTIINIVDTMSAEISAKINAGIENRNIYFSYIIIFFLFMNILIFLILYFTKIQQEEHDNKILKLKELYDNTINSIDNIIFVKDTNFIYITCNSSFEKLLGKSKDEIIGKNDYELFTKDVADSFRKYDKQMFANKNTESNYEWVTYPDGTKIYLFTTKSPLIDSTGKIIGLVGNSIDFTDREHTLKQLRQKTNELATIIQEAPYPIAIHNEDGKVMMLNQAWCDYSGYTLEDLPTINDFINFMVEDDMKEKMKEISKNLYHMTERDEAMEHTLLAKNGDKIIWQFGSAPLGITDGKRTVISSAMDITELKQKDEMLINQSRHAAMGEMIGMIAHQWRQPLSTISMDANNMLLDIALGEFSTTTSEEYANSISEQTQHLSQTIDDFRNFFKPDKVISKVNIKNILDQTLSIVKDSLTNNTITLTSSFETEKKVDAYPRELMQVFVNIITNAKDALVHNKIKNAQIAIKVSEDEKYINTEICDNGGGIDADILPKVFDPYFSTKEEQSGTGLGLYMSKMIIEEHLHGIIEVTNKDDGVCFTVRLLKEDGEK